MDDVNRKKPMEFWLHLKLNRRQNVFIVILLVNLFASNARCENHSTKYSDYYQNGHFISNKNDYQHRLQSFNKNETFDSNIEQKTVRGFIPTKNQHKENDQVTMNGINTKMNDLKPESHRKVHNLQNTDENTGLVKLKTIQHEYSSGKYDIESHYDSTIYASNKLLPLPTNIPNSKPKKTNVNLFAMQSNDKNASASWHIQNSNKYWLSNNKYNNNIGYLSNIKQHKTNSNSNQRKYNVKPIQRNCNRCRIIPGSPVRHKTYYPSSRVIYRGMFPFCLLSLFLFF